MAAYNFHFYNQQLDLVSEFMFGNLDEEVDMTEALTQAFIENEFCEFNDPELVSKEDIANDIRLVKVDQETMTAVIIIEDVMLGKVKIVGTVEEI